MLIFNLILGGNWGSFGEPWEPNLQGFLRAKNAAAPSGVSDCQWDGSKHARTSKMKLSLERGAYFAQRAFFTLEALLGRKRGAKRDPKASPGGSKSVPER